MRSRSSVRISRVRLFTTSTGESTSSGSSEILDAIRRSPNGSQSSNQSYSTNSSKQQQHLLISHLNPQDLSNLPTLTPPMLTTLLSRTRDPDLALNLFNWATTHSPTFSHNTFTFNALLTSFLRVSRPDLALHHFRSNPLNLLPDSITYNILISAFCNDLDLSTAFELLREMDLEGAQPNDRTESIILHGLCRSGDLDQAMIYLEESLFGASVVSYSTVINGLCKSGRVELAFELLRKMLASNRCSFPNTFTFNTLIDALCKQDKIPAAEALLQEAQKRWSFTPDAITYNTLISSLFETGKVDRALHFFNLMCDEKLTPTLPTFNAIISGLVKSLRLEEALQVFNEMIDRGLQPNLITYSIVINVLSRSEHQQLDEARELLSSWGTAGLGESTQRWSSSPRW